MSDNTDSTMFCSNCRAVLSADIEYCTECGTEQNVPSGSNENLDPEFLPATKKYCGNCGEVVDQAAAYCGSCGSNTSESNGAESKAKISDWLIGLSPNNTLQNVAAAVFFYFLLYPIGVPVLLYSYLHIKKGMNRIYVIASAAILAVLLFISALII